MQRGQALIPFSTFTTGRQWGIHPEDLVTHRFTLDEAPEAYRLMAEGKCGKAAVVFDEEVK